MNAYGVIRTLGVVVLLSGASVQCFKELSEFGKWTNDKVNPPGGKLIGVNTPVWIATRNDHGTIQHQKMEEGFVGKVVTRFYSSNPHILAISLDRKKRDKPSFDEIVSGLHIRSLPKHFQKRSTSVKEQEDKIRRLERQIREASRSDDGTHRPIMEYIYPSLLIQTDLAGLMEPEIIDFDNDIIYQIAFWNNADSIFGPISEPKIRIRIAGIIIGDRLSTPFVQQNVSAENRAIEMGKFWYNMSQNADFPLSSYHIVIAMTDNDHLDSGLLVTTGPSLCKPPQNVSFVSSGIFHADVRFGGTFHAVYLLLNILGVLDGDLIGAECQMPNDDLWTTLKGQSLEWPQCARDRFSNLARKGYLNCYAQPAEFYPPGDAVRKVLPGDLVSPDAQCRSRGAYYSGACEPSDQTCVELQCRFMNLRGLFVSNMCQGTGRPVEGTACSNGYKCFRGWCYCFQDQCLYTSNSEV